MLIPSNKKLTMIKRRKLQPLPLPESSDATLELLLQSSSSSIAISHLTRKCGALPLSLKSMITSFLFCGLFLMLGFGFEVCFL